MDNSKSRFKVSEASLSCITGSKYFDLKKFKFKINDFQAYYDLVLEPMSVSVIIFDKSKNSLVYVRQFRAGKLLLIEGVYLAVNKEFRDALLKGNVEDNVINYPPGESGVRTELCAGFADPGESPEKAAVREMFEETGYKISETRLTFIRKQIAHNGSTLTEKDKISDVHGLAEEGEDIELVYIPIMHPREMTKLLGENPSSNAIDSVYWFHCERISSASN